MSPKRQSGVMVRVSLSEREYAALQRLSKSSGVPISRLAADAIRQTHLRPARAAA